MNKRIVITIGMTSMFLLGACTEESSNVSGESIAVSKTSVNEKHYSTEFITEFSEGFVTVFGLTDTLLEGISEMANTDFNDRTEEQGDRLSNEAQEVMFEVRRHRMDSSNSEEEIKAEKLYNDYLSKVELLAQTLASQHNTEDKNVHSDLLQKTISEIDSYENEIKALAEEF